MEEKSEYIAVKIKGFRHYIWFERKKVSEGGGKFVGLDGWGKDGHNTTIEVSAHEIEGKIFSNNLQYY